MLAVLSWFPHLLCEHEARSCVFYARGAEEGGVATTSYAADGAGVADVTGRNCVFFDISSPVGRRATSKRRVVLLLPVAPNHRGSPEIRRVSLPLHRMRRSRMHGASKLEYISSIMSPSPYIATPPLPCVPRPLAASEALVRHMQVLLPVFHCHTLTRSRRGDSGR